jgi:UDP-N-acetylglucosamine acyltransferase
VTATVDPRSAVHPSALIGAGCRIGPFCVVEEGVRLGDDCVLEPFARICRNVSVGDRVLLGQGSVVGGMAQVRASMDDGKCRVGDDCRVGEYATVNRSSSDQGETVLENGVLILAYAHVAHDCRVGDCAVLANGVQLGGHVEVGRHAFLGGGTHVHQHVRIGALAFAAGRIRLDRDLAPWSRGLGEPARWAGFNRVPFGRIPDPPDSVLAQEALRILFRRKLRLDEAVTMLSSRNDLESVELGRFVQGGRRGLLRPKD